MARGLAPGSPRETLRDVYRGVAVHEGSHVFHTRGGFLRMAGSDSERRRLYENLFEDERIDDLACRESPGSHASWKPPGTFCWNAVHRAGRLGDGLRKLLTRLIRSNHLA